MMKKWMILFDVVVLIIAVSAAALFVQNYNGMQRPEEIKIGLILPLTGPLSSLGNSLHNSLLLAADDVNEKNMLGGKKISIISEDTQSDPRNAVEAYNKLRNIDNAKVFLSVTSGHVLAIKPLTERDHVLFFGSAAHPDVTKNSSLIFRHANTAQEDARTLADAILKNNYTKVGIIHINDDWGISTESILRGLLEARNITVISEKHEQRDTDFRTQLTKLSQTDAIVDISAGTSAGLIIKQTKELGYSRDFYSGVGFSLTPDAAEIAGDAANGIFYQEYPIHPEFERKYRDRFGKSPAKFSQTVYTLAELTSHAIRQTESADPETLAAYIKSLKHFNGTYESVIIMESGEIPLSTFIKRYP